jgi:glucose/arabinose dehydrogenase
MILSKKIMISALVAASAVALHTGAAAHSINAGDRADTPVRPFMSEAIAEFDRPWAVAFLPDGRMVITEKYGKIFLVNQAGQKTEVGNVPPSRPMARMVCLTLPWRQTLRQIIEFT